MAEYLDREKVLMALCWYCDHKCDAEKHKDKAGYGIRCGSYLAINSMDEERIPISRIRVTQNGDNNVCIDNVGTLNLDM